MIKYIGDISKQDAEVLKEYAQISKRILEFGCGASTQVLSNYANDKIISLDTEQFWIDETIKNLKNLGITDKVIFQKYEDFDYKGEYDLIFVDGLWKERLPFAIKTWSLLPIGGVMILHDTRRKKDIDNVLTILEKYWLEIGDVNINKNHSNMTVITKKEYTPYVNWNIVEKK